VQAQAALRP